MFRRLMNALLATRTTSSGARAAGQPNRRNVRRPALERLEDRLVPSSVPLHVAGNQLEDPAGNTVTLRGVNITSLEYRPDDDNVLLAVNTAINSWHANILRLPVNEDFWFGHDEFWTGAEAGDGGAAYRALVDQVISTAQADNVYVVLDLHWSDMGVWGANNGQHFMPDDHSTLFWQDAAVRYANNPAVFYDPYNEPTVGISNPSDADFATWRDGGMITETDLNTGAVIGTYHSPGMQGLINTIRATGANNIVVPEGLDFGSDLTGVLTGHALSDPAGELMYQSHLYYDKLAIQSIADSVASVSQQYPIYIGEWGNGGVIGQPSQEAADSNNNSVAYFEQHHYNWSGWAFFPDFENGPFNMFTDWNTFTPTSDYGAIVKQALTANIVTANNQAPTIASAAASSANPVTGMTTDLSVLGADAGGEANLIYTWAVTDTSPAGATFSVNGSNAAKDTTMTFSQAGDYTFVVTVTNAAGLTATSSVDVVVETPSPVADLTGVHFSLTAAEDGSTHDLLIQSETVQPDGTAQITGLWDGQSASGTLSGNSDGTIAISFGPSANEGIDGTISGNPGQYTIFGINRADSGGIAPELNGNQVVLAAQTITFDPLADATFGDAPITLNGTATSGLPVSYQVLSGPASIQDNILTITGVGVVTVEASQAGDGVNFDAATPVDQSFTVNQAATAVALQTSAHSATVGKMITFTATVASQNPDAGQPDGTVTWLDGGNVLGTATLTNGVAVLQTSSLGAGTHHVTAVYSGSDDFMDSSSHVVTETIKRAATRTALTSSARTAVHEQTIELTARINMGATGAVSAGGTVTFKDGARVLAKVTVTNGVAILDIANLKRGKHSITAVYSGDVDFVGSSSSAVSVTIK
jgi:hypothetical protein